jgi:hypothetical protein
MHGLAEVDGAVIGEQVNPFAGAARVGTERVGRQERAQLPLVLEQLKAASEISQLRLEPLIRIHA